MKTCLETDGTYLVMVKLKDWKQRPFTIKVRVALFISFTAQEEHLVPVL